MTQQAEAKNITAADVLAGMTADWCYSDAHKDIYGFRPRGHSAEQEAWFWNNFDSLWQNMQEEDERQLQSLRDHYQQEFPTWMSYFDFMDDRREQEYQAQLDEQAMAQAERREFLRRGSPLPIIQAWEHGDRLAA